MFDNPDCSKKYTGQSVRELKPDLKRMVSFLLKKTTLLTLYNIYREADMVQDQSIILGIFYLQIKRII